MPRGHARRGIAPATTSASASVVASGRVIAIFNDQGAYHAIDDLCPHMGASLSAGELHEGIVTCPWHGWRFNVTTGVSPVVSSISVKKYEVKVEGNDVLVAVEER